MAWKNWTPRTSNFTDLKSLFTRRLWILFVPRCHASAKYFARTGLGPPWLPSCLVTPQHRWLLMVKYSAKSQPILFRTASQKINQYLKYFCLMSGCAQRQWTWILFLRRLKKYFLDKVFAGSIGLRNFQKMDYDGDGPLTNVGPSAHSFAPSLYRTESLLGKDSQPRQSLTMTEPRP